MELTWSCLNGHVFECGSFVMVGQQDANEVVSFNQQVADCSLA